MSKRIVIALGGNALGNTAAQQLELVSLTAKPIVDLIAAGNEVIIAHGNGPQVGMMRRLFICLDDRDLPEEVPANYEYKFIEFINPEILELSDEQVELYEGCLSFPGHNGAIKRSKHVKVKAQDRHGEWFELEADDMLARCIQHENNHLDGITIMESSEFFYEDTEEGRAAAAKKKEND